MNCVLLKTCLIVPSFPWDFGPYQKQMYTLGKNLNDRGHTIYWWSTTANMDDNKGEIHDTSFVHKKYKKNYHYINDSFINYVSLNIRTKYIRFSDMNRLSNAYNLDNIILLQDVDNVIRDEDALIPLTMWYPCHFENVPTIDLYTLRGFSNVVTLSPSIEVPYVKKTYIPHAVTISSKKKDKLFPENKFIVLLQAGNYEEFDRKGFFSAFHSFSIFRETVPNAYLYVHSPSINTIFSYNERIDTSDAQISKGQPLHYFKMMFNISDNDITIDDNIYDRATVFAMKKQADVCLHPSKVEGFGMNVVECQLAGTPVVTTAFGAMKDNTCLGISVPPASVTFYLRGIVAEPDSYNIGKALNNIFVGNYFTNSTFCKKWIRREFSPKYVADKFDSMLKTSVTIPNFYTGALHMKSHKDYLIYGDNVTNYKWLTCCGMNDSMLTNIPEIMDYDIVQLKMFNGKFAIILKMYLVVNIQVHYIDFENSLKVFLKSNHVTRKIVEI